MKKCNIVNNVESYISNKIDWIAYKLKNNDRPVILQNLLTENKKQFVDVASYSFDNSRQWFTYVLNTSQKELTLLNLKSGKEKKYSFEKSYLFSPDGNALLINNGSDLKYIDLTKQTSNSIWETTDNSKTVSDYQFDQLGKQIVFIVQDITKKTISNSIWYYGAGMDKAKIKVDDSTLGIGDSLEIQEGASFTDNSSYIQFTLRHKQKSLQAMSNEVHLDVFSYKDLMLHSDKADLSRQTKIYKAIISVKNNQVVSLENDGRTLYLLQGDFAIIKKYSKETHGDRFWEVGFDNNEDSNWLVSLKDGDRRLLPTTSGNGALWFSPSGNYLVYFDAQKDCHYFSYDLRTGKIKDISANVSDGQLGKVETIYRTDEKPKYPFCPAAWLKDDASLLVYDTHDIWKLDLAGEKPAVNITNGFGRSHDIIFSLFYGGRIRFDTPILNEEETLTLRAFNIKNKCNGFYRRAASAVGDPKLLSMGQYFMNIIAGCQDLNLSNEGMPPLKAANAGVWIVQRQSSVDAPNYYKTNDFKTFERLSNVQHRKEFNWISEELHSFKHLGGGDGQGILIKPENFDPFKKYPVLIIFYGNYSANFQQFPIPSYNENAISPGMSPNWILNNGCLVFTPDIYVAPLKYGPEAFNVIEGAVSYLKHLPYIDSNKIGCAAHSWSAKLGSYLFTHSKSFAAMAISEGYLYADPISVALSPSEKGLSQLAEVERGFQYGNFWQHKESWLDQTTVVNVDKSNSPLLLLCNKQSSQEYQNQTFELFSALRRLEKSVWWLRYDKEGHILYDLNDQKDYTIRYTQYFDHYLSNAPPPKWMTQGIPNALKGIESRYELDPEGSCSKDCPICRKWNEQYRKHAEMFHNKIS